MLKNMVLCRKSIVFFLIQFILFQYTTHGQSNLKGNPKAITAVKEMVEVMGGARLWSEIKQLHFRHVWYPINRESFVEDEIIDLTGPRSWVHMKSEIFDRYRAYSPEHGYWSLLNGKYSESEESLKNAMKRAPFNLYRMVHAIAKDTFPFEIRMGETDIPTGIRIEVIMEDGTPGGSIVLDGANRPLVWETKQFRYTFGPMKKFGNLWVPNWAIYDKGSFRYEMLDLKGDNHTISPEKFKPIRNLEGG